MDPSIDPEDAPDSPDAPSDTELQGAEFPIPLDSLAQDGTNPSVGDDVTFNVDATVTRIVNDMAYVKPTKVDGQELPAPALKTNPGVSEEDRLQKLSMQHDANGGGDY